LFKWPGPHVVTFCEGGTGPLVYSIKSLTTPSLSYSSTNFCIGDGTASPVITSGYSNSFWEADNNTGLTLNPTTGVIDLQTSSPGVYNIVGNLTPSAPCLSNSLDTFQLTISASTASTISAVACDTYTVNSQTYTVTGSYTQILTNAAGCDSIVTINLTINTVDAGITETNNVLSANLAGATYQWVDCNNGNQAIANETFQSYSPTVNGSYAVVVTVNGCSETSTCMAIISIGIEKNNFKNFLSIYPNPSTGLLTIKAIEKIEGNYQVEFYNTHGQRIITQKLTSDAISLNNFENGIYLVRLLNHSGVAVYTNRFILQK
jgi:hydroxyethylthiazole kinase-like sugar kinase family protein